MTVLYDLADELDEGLAKAKKWAPMVFAKNGKNALSYKRFDSEYECIVSMEVALKKWQERGGTPETWIGVSYPDEYFCQMKDYSHFIPMPVGD